MIKEKNNVPLNHKWEYLVKKIDTAFGGRIKIDDKELSELGKQRWELVSVSLVNQANMFTGQVVTAVMIFKRKLSE